MSLQSLKRKDLLQTLNPDLPLTLLTLTVLCVLVVKLSLWLALNIWLVRSGEKHRCVTLNF